MAEGIKAASNVLIEFRKILEQCFGPNCKDVLMKSDTGVIYLSSSGDFIMNHLVLKHPVAKLIKDTVSVFKETNGDFSKSFIIVLSHFSSQFVGKHIDLKTSRNIETVSSTLSNTALSLFCIRDYIKEQFTKYEISKTFSYEEFMQHQRYIHSLLATSLTGKLDDASTTKMIEIVLNIFHHPQFKYDMFEYFVHHFHDICISMVGLPFNKSHIINGCFIARESKPPEFKLDNARFVLISSIGDSIQDSKKATLLLKNDSPGVFQTSYEHKMYTLLVKVLKKHCVNVIFTEDPLPNRLSSSLQQLEIVIVPFVLEEDLQRLNKLYNIPLISGIYDLHNLTEKQIGAASMIESMVLGRTKGCLLGPSAISESLNMNKDILNTQILLCTPSQGLQMQYRHMLHNLFKIVSKSFCKKNKQFTVVTGGGHFEQYLSNILRKHEKHDCIDDIERSVCKILANSVEAIPHLLHRNSGFKPKLSDNVFPRSSICDIELDLSKTNCKTSSKWNSNEICFEPFHVKCELYTTLLEFIMQLVKIQYIIPVTRKTVIDCTLSDDEE